MSGSEVILPLKSTSLFPLLLSHPDSSLLFSGLIEDISLLNISIMNFQKLIYKKNMDLG